MIYNIKYTEYNNIDIIRKKKIDESKIDVPIYFINLDKDINRKNYILDQLNEIKLGSFKRIPAILGKDIKYKYQNYKYTDGELGTLLSHLKALKEFKESNNKYALILEDDVSLRLSYKWKYKLSEICNNLPKNWVTCQLFFIPSKNEDLLNGISKSNDSWGAAAYLISKIGATEILNQIDQFGLLNLNIVPLADWILFRLFKERSYRIYPRLIFTDNIINTSTLHADQDEWHNRVSLKIIEEINFN